jgi:hypothetical protein
MASGYTIEGPDGAEFSVTQAVTTGHPHTIDMRTGLLSVDGAVVYGQVSSGDTWEIPAGSAVSMTLVPVAGSGTLTATVRDTFE